MIDNCGKCEDDARITETELKDLEMTKEVSNSQNQNQTKKNDLEELMKKLGLVMIGLLLLPVIFAQPTVMFYNCVHENNGFICNIDKNNPISYINIYNPGGEYNVTIHYSGTSISLYKSGILLGFGNSFNAKFSINTGTTTLVVYLPPNGGSSTFNFTFSSNNQTYNKVYNVRYVVNTSSTQTVNNVNKSTNQKVNVVLQPLYTKVKYVIYTGKKYSFVLGVFNSGNVPIDLLDISIEGMPPDIAYLEAKLTKLDPGQYLYYNLIIDARNLTPGTYNFFIRYVGKYNNNLTYAYTSVNLEVVSGKFSNYTFPVNKKPELNLDYSIEDDYLVIRGAYINMNNKRIYVNAKIMVMAPGGITLSYYYPIKVLPGESYCIYAESDNTIPYFNCFKVPTRPLCYVLSPKPTVYNGKEYYLVGTNVTIKEVYDCKTLDPIYRYKILVNGEIYSSNTIYINKPIRYSIQIRSDGYTPTNITVYGYKEVTVSNIPMYPGVNTITLSGTFAKSSKIILYEFVNGTTKKVKEGIGSITYNFTPGSYEIFVNAPLQGNFSRYFTIVVPYIPRKSINLLDIAKNIFWYALIGFLIFTIIAVVVYRRQTNLYELAQDIMKQAKK